MPKRSVALHCTPSTTFWAGLSVALQPQAAASSKQADAGRIRAQLHKERPVPTQKGKNLKEEGARHRCCLACALPERVYGVSRRRRGTHHHHPASSSFHPGRLSLPHATATATLPHSTLLAFLPPPVLLVAVSYYKSIPVVSLLLPPSTPHANESAPLDWAARNPPPPPPIPGPVKRCVRRPLQRPRIPCVPCPRARAVALSCRAPEEERH